MKPAKYDISYDRNLAIALAHRLNHRLKNSNSSSPNTPTPASESHISPPENSPTSLPSLEVPASNFNDLGVFREEVWLALLDWALTLSKSKWAYVSDEHGLIIAEKGDKGKLTTDETSSSIANAVHSLRNSSGEEALLKIVSLRTVAGWISALSCPLPEQLDKKKTYLIIGLVGESQPTTKISEYIHTVFAKKTSTF